MDKISRFYFGICPYEAAWAAAYLGQFGVSVDIVFGIVDGDKTHYMPFREALNTLKIIESLLCGLPEFSGEGEPLRAVSQGELEELRLKTFGYEDCAWTLDELAETLDRAYRSGFRFFVEAHLWVRDEETFTIFCDDLFRLAELVRISSSERGRLGKKVGEESGGSEW